MSTTAFAAIQAALLAAIMASPALASGNISVNRQRPIASGQSCAIVLRMDHAAGTEMVIGALDWQTTFIVECYATGAAGSDPSSAVDALLSDTWARLSALSFESLGASISLDPHIEWQYDDVAVPIVCAVIRLTAQHRTTTLVLQP